MLPKSGLDFAPGIRAQNRAQIPGTSNDLLRGAGIRARFEARIPGFKSNPESGAQKKISLVFCSLADRRSLCGDGSIMPSPGFSSKPLTFPVRCRSAGLGACTLFQPPEKHLLNEQRKHSLSQSCITPNTNSTVTPMLARMRYHISGFLGRPESGNINRQNCSCTLHTMSLDLVLLSEGVFICRSRFAQGRFGIQPASI